MATFGIAIRVFPRKSQPATVSTDYPNGVPYEARAIYSSKPLDIPTQEGGVFSDQATVIDINTLDFEVLPVQGDRVQILPGQIAGVGGDLLWFISDVDEDGQGGVMLAIQKSAPEELSPEEDYE